MLKCSVVHYLRNFPWCYYLAGGLLRSEEPVVSLFLSPDVSAALISRRRQHVGFEMEDRQLAGCAASPGTWNSPGNGQPEFQHEAAFSVSGKRRSAVLVPARPRPERSVLQHAQHGEASGD